MYMSPFAFHDNVDCRCWLVFRHFIIFKHYQTILSFIITIHSSLLYSKNPFKSFIFITLLSQKMMHRSSQGQHVMGHCSCGMFHGQNNSFSMLFSKPYDEPETYCFTPNSSSSSSVDCTLSLGTPSTRFTEDEEKRSRHERRSVKNFCWDLLTPKQYNSTQSQTKATRATTNNYNNNSNNDSLLARRCANCDTTSTPLWRNGPRGPKVKIINMCINSKYTWSLNHLCSLKITY